MILGKSDIVGHCIVRFVEYYLGTTHDIGMAWYAFQLDSGIVFSFPRSPGVGLLDSPIQDGADDLTFHDHHEITHSPIVAVLRPIDDSDHGYYQDSIFIQLASGHWISQMTSAPLTVGGPQLFACRETPDDLHEMTDFWSQTPSKPPTH